MDDQTDTTIDAVVLHPPVGAYFQGMEHAAGELQHLGDALGIDCIVVRHDGRWVRAYRGEGNRNNDWCGWREPLLAPVDSTVETIRINKVVNRPGALGKPPASAIVFAAADGLRVTYGHCQAIQVEPGETVRAGQVVASIGNNGMCWHPHVHVGAWLGDVPLQIRFDLVAMARLRAGRLSG